MNAASLAFAAYMADDALRRDFGVLIDCNRHGEDYPAKWFWDAAHAYPPEATLPHNALRLVALDMAHGVAS